MFHLGRFATERNFQSDESAAESVASAWLAVAAGAQEPQCTPCYMRIPSTAGRRQAPAQQVSACVLQALCNPVHSRNQHLLQFLVLAIPGAPARQGLDLDEAHRVDVGIAQQD